MTKQHTCVVERRLRVRDSDYNWYDVEGCEFVLMPNSFHPNEVNGQHGVWTHYQRRWSGTSEMAHTALAVHKAFYAMLGHKGHGRVMTVLRPGSNPWTELATDANPIQLHAAVGKGEFPRGWIQGWLDNEELCKLTRPDLVEALREELARVERHAAELVPA